MRGRTSGNSKHKIRDALIAFMRNYRTKSNRIEMVDGCKMKIYIGTSGYSYKEWKGKFYPEKISPNEMLRFYSERFNVVEINNTFYHMPRENVLVSWAEQVPDDFIFALKAPQIITHLKRLRNVDEETAYLFRSLSILDGKLGPVLFQFPKSFHKDQPALKEFLDLVPGNMICAFDFRSPTWLDGQILDLLRERKCSLCIEDMDENPANEIISTAPWGYLRLRRSDYRDADLSQWMKGILSQKWKRAFVFFKHEDEAKGPQMAMRFRELTGSGLKEKMKYNYYKISLFAHITALISIIDPVSVIHNIIL